MDFAHVAKSSPTISTSSYICRSVRAITRSKTHQTNTVIQTGTKGHRSVEMEGCTLDRVMISDDNIHGMSRFKCAESVKIVALIVSTPS